MAAADALASVTFMPLGKVSGLSRRSTSISSAAASTATVTRIGTPSGGVRGKGSCTLTRVTCPGGRRRIAAAMRASP